MAQTARQVVLTVADVAALIGRSPKAVRHAIRRRQIPARRWGGRVVILREDLEAHLRALPLREVAR
jgi:excisionase family DNA binding protein